MSPDIHDQGGQPGMSSIDYLVWDAGHSMYRKEETSDIGGEEKEETEGDRTQLNRNPRI